MEDRKSSVLAVDLSRIEEEQKLWLEKREKKVGYDTRKETIIIDNLKRYLNTIFNKKNKDEIKYIYFECFDRKEEDAKKAYEKLKLHIDKADLVVINKLKSLVKVLKK